MAEMSDTHDVSEEDYVEVTVLSTGRILCTSCCTTFP